MWVALGIFVTIVLALLGVIWTLLNDRINDRATSLDDRIEALWDQVGRSSEEGMRKTVHKSSNACTQHELAISEHGRRFGSIEKRVFNGHRRQEED